MQEAANIRMRSEPHWNEVRTSDATFAYRCQDAVMTIFPDGSWRCEIPQGFSMSISTGKFGQLDAFLKQLVADNL
jgi:hypothetical protein